MSPLLIEAPTDAQLGFIAKLCQEQGWEPPPAVHSKTEAATIIDAMRASTYRPEQFTPRADVLSCSRCQIEWRAYFDRFANDIRCTNCGQPMRFEALEDVPF